MLLDLARRMKRTRDREARLPGVDPGKGLVVRPGTPERYIEDSPAPEPPPPVPEPPQHVEPAEQKFRQLTDTPGSYSGHGEKVVSVREDEQGLEFTEPSGGDVDLPDFMDIIDTSLHTGLAVYDSAEKTNMVALIGRKGDEVSEYQEQTTEDFEKGLLTDAAPTAMGLQIASQLSPDKIGGLSLWLDAGHGVTVDEHNKVSQWKDRSIHGREFDSDGENEPELLSGELNGLPVISFGVDDQLEAATRTGLLAFTRFFVLKATHPTVNSRLFIDSRFAFAWRDDGAQFSFSMEPASGIRPFVISGWNTSGWNLAVVSRVLDDPASFWLSQASQSTSGTNNRRWSELAAHRFGPAAHSFQVAEVLTYNADLTTADRQKVETYLARKYGLNIPTPADYFFNEAERIALPFDLTPLGTDPGLYIRWAADEPADTEVVVETAVTGETSYTDEVIGQGEDREIEVVSADMELQETDATTWQHDYYNDPDGDLILITTHHRNGDIISITYGGVPAQLIAKQDADWPQTYIYAITSKAQLAVDETHTLEVLLDAGSGSGVGATSLTKVKNVHPDILDNLNEIINATQYVSSGSSVSTDITTTHDGMFLLDAVTARGGGEGFSPDAAQTLVGYGVFDEPRGAGVSYKTVETAGSTSMSWSEGTGNERIRHVVVGIRPAGLQNTFVLPDYPADRHDDLVISVDGSPVSEYELNTNNPVEVVFNEGHEPGDGLDVTAMFTAVVSPEELDWEEQNSDTQLTNDLSGDLTGKHLWIRQILTTTDTEITPTLQELTIFSGSEEFGVFTADGSVGIL